MKYDELMTGADALNAYYKAVQEYGINRMNPTMAAAEELAGSYEHLMADYAEMAGCYCEWDARRTEGLGEA